MLNRRQFAAGAAATVLATQAHANTYPSRPIKLMIGYAPGGSTDGPARALAERVGALLGQPVVIENKPGASGTMPIQALQTSAPDGYTLAMAPSSTYRVPFTSEVKWDPLTDLSYVIGITGYTFGIVVRADSPLKTFADYLKFARENPGELTYGTSGVGSTNHMTMEQMARQYKLQLRHIPYKGGAESVQAALAGEVMSAAEGSNWVPMVDAGKLRLLVVWNAKRIARYPQVPTLRESGIDIVQNAPWGLVGPKGLQPAIAARLHDAFKQAMETENFRKALDTYVMEPDYRSGADYRTYATQAVARERELVQALGLARAASRGGA
ncbi:hypothetical protein CCO03_16250 [Comamonas serinivorans]|uniref:ABC transporter substrate-binding protein n=1 Tax=Comamonas serinivorans TaxID=1082851 RepID=A0A1Y0ERI9_9BURK|nr:tripartite tricarboxylate transporter substrate binding protein [Comamonas serinivorans]ARU06011.1 hypothetical protein CCO03_16250 [Comamonas serinivorans]